jgi:hypothetical protein
LESIFCYYNRFINLLISQGLSQNGKITSLAENRALFEDKLSKDRDRSIEEVAGCPSLMLLILNPILGNTLPKILILEPIEPPK